jgi:hypothetical protein
MHLDGYTKFILTVIAISLTVIATRPMFGPVAAAADMGGCGYDVRHACYVIGWGPEGTIPIANAGHLPLKVLVGNPGAYPLPVVVVNPPTPLNHR